MTGESPFFFRLVFFFALAVSLGSSVPDASSEGLRRRGEGGAGVTTAVAAALMASYFARAFVTRASARVR